MWDCTPIKQGHGYLRKIWKFSNGGGLVFGPKRAFCIFISIRDRVSCIIWVLGELSEMAHTSWPTGFMSLCIESDLRSYGQLNGLFCMSFRNAVRLWLPVCVTWCLWQCANSLYGWLIVNVLLLAKLFTPFSHAKIKNTYLESECALPASWQPIPLPKIPTTSLERKYVLGREQRPKCDWEKLVNKTVQRKRKLYLLQEPTWFIM